SRQGAKGRPRMKGRRFLLAGTAAVAALVAGLPATPSSALKPARLIPCATPSLGAVTLGSGASTIDTSTLVINGPSGQIGVGQVVDNVAVFGFDSLAIPAGAGVTVTGSRPLAILSRTTITIAGFLGTAPGGAGGGAGGPSLSAGGETGGG